MDLDVCMSWNEIKMPVLKYFRRLILVSISNVPTLIGQPIDLYGEGEMFYK